MFTYMLHVASRLCMPRKRHGRKTHGFKTVKKVFFTLHHREWRFISHVAMDNERQSEWMCLHLKVNGRTARRIIRRERGMVEEKSMENENENCNKEVTLRIYTSVEVPIYAISHLFLYAKDEKKRYTTPLHQ